MYYSFGSRVLRDVKPYGSYLIGTIVESNLHAEVGHKCIFGPNFFLLQQEKDWLPKYLKEAIMCE